VHPEQKLNKPNPPSPKQNSAGTGRYNITFIKEADTRV